MGVTMIQRLEQFLTLAGLLSLIIIFDYLMRYYA